MEKYERPQDRWIEISAKLQVLCELLTLGAISKEEGARRLDVIKEMMK